MCTTDHVLLALPLLLAVGCGRGSGAGPDDDVGDDGGDPSRDCADGLGDWTGHDDVAPRQQPPCGLAPAEVPQFVAIGFDDNGKVEGMQWAADMLAARGAKATFFLTSSYAQPAMWKMLYDAGHEIGNHTVTHATDRTVPRDRWLQEMRDCNTYLTGTVGIPADAIHGFRTPYLEYSDDTLAAEQEVGFRYDASIEEGYEDGEDGTNYYWPYTLDDRSPGHTAQVAWGEGLAEINPHAGLWELPVYAVVVPPALRATMATRQTWFDPANGLITGFDYNLWASVANGGFEMTKDEFIATLEYTLDQRLAGNRAPLLFGAHSDFYVADWNANAPGTPSELDRRAAIEAVLDYAGSKSEVSIGRFGDVLDWLRNPTAR